MTIYQAFKYISFEPEGRNREIILYARENSKTPDIKKASSEIIKNIYFSIDLNIFWDSKNLKC